MAAGYALIYPTPKVPLDELTRAALALAGVEEVQVVSGAGSQALRVPEGKAADIYDFAGLTADGEDIPDPPSARIGDPAAPDPAPSKPASGTGVESPGPGAPKAAPKPTAATEATGRPAARPAGRGSKKAAKKTTTTRTTTGAPKKEGDDQ